MCSWCWGYRRVWDELRLQLPESVTVVNVVGGLAPDTDETMPLEQQKTIASYWAKVGEQTGAEFNLEFWQKCQPRRSTYPACRAVLAARKQNAEQAMIDAIQQAYYLRAMNPSDNSTLINLASELTLDEKQFADDLASEQIQVELEQDFALRRKIAVYSFPSLVLEHCGELYPIEIDYQHYQSSLKAILSRVVAPLKD
jgi:putative protein-disulfide isomerase